LQITSRRLHVGGGQTQASTKVETYYQSPKVSGYYTPTYMKPLVRRSAFLFIDFLKCISLKII